jgi:uncharacterized protein
MRGHGIIATGISVCSWLIAAFCLPIVPAAHAQQFINPNTAATAVCSSSPGRNDQVAACDPRAVEELARNGQAFAEKQMGMESALVVAPGHTIRDARKWFEKAARQGDGSAQVNLAVLYLNGWGVEKNYGTALYWLNAAAHQDNPRAHTNLGILYMNGLGVRQDYAEAMRHFQFAAGRGETGAMVDLGYLYDSGLGTPKNQAEAANWYRLAAEQGDALGQNNLADLYLRGEGVAQSDALALQWFQKAAQQGNTAARIKLGYLYASGRAGRVDPEAAYAWISAAQLAGDRRGEEYLVPLEKQLTAAQLAHAMQHAQELLATPAHAKVELAFVR